MLNLIAAALIAVAPATSAPDPHAQHAQHGQNHSEHQGHGGAKATSCCEHHQAGHKMECCKDMADARQAKACCAEHAKGSAGDSRH